MKVGEAWEELRNVLEKADENARQVFLGMNRRYDKNNTIFKEILNFMDDLEEKHE